MRLKILLIAIWGFAIISCEYDYSDYMEKFTPQVVVNSFINPDEDIKVAVIWAKEFSDTTAFKGVKNFSARIYENETLVFEASNLSDSIITTHRPKTGAEYRLVADIPNYGEVSANTYIPYKPITNIEFTGIKNGEYSARYYYHFEIEELEVNEKLRSIMVRSNWYYEKTYPTKYASIFVKNSYLDQFNTNNDDYGVEYSGSDIGYYYYTRIPYVNISNAMPLTFSTVHPGNESYQTDNIIGYDDYDYPMYETIYINATHFDIEVISPSNEYDRYLKDAYLQKLNQDIDPGIFNMAIPMPFNIENGLGIFAGYSSVKLKMEIKDL